MAKITLGKKKPAETTDEKPAVDVEATVEAPKKSPRAKIAKKEEPAKEETALATQDDGESAALTLFDSDSNGIDGMTAEDLKEYGVSLPGLKLITKNAKVADDHPELIGHYLYDGSFDLGTSLEVITLSVAWRWQEKTEYVPGGGGESGQIMTNEEFEASDFEKSDVSRICIMNLAIVVDDPDEEEKKAAVEIDGAWYFLATYWATGFSTEFPKKLCQKIKDYGGATYNRTTHMQAGKRAWKGESFRVSKWTGMGSPVDQETLIEIAKVVDTHAGE